MKSALLSTIQYYLPGHQLQPHPIYNLPAYKSPISEPNLFDALTSIELHENKYRIISYGCSLNLYNDQLAPHSRLSRYGFPSPGITSLDRQYWQNREPTHTIHSRLVSELSRRLNLTPQPVSISLLAKKLRTTIPEADVAHDKHRRRDTRFAGAENEIRFPSTRKQGDPIPTMVRDLDTQMEFNSKSLRKMKRAATRPHQEIDEDGDGEALFVPSWGQYVRKAMLKYRFSRESGILTIGTGVEPSVSLYAGDNEVEIDDVMVDKGLEAGVQRSIEDVQRMVVDNRDASHVKEERPRDKTTSLQDESETFQPPPNLDDIIQWSTDVDFSFIPYVHPRRSVVSPRELRDQEYLGDPSRSEGLLLDYEWREKKRPKHSEEVDDTENGG